MGGGESKQVSLFLDHIVCGKDGQVAIMLKKYPQLAKCEFFKGTTNPMCRATYLGHRNIVQLLMKYEADINKPSQNGRTPIIWASFRENIKMCELLMSYNPDLTMEDEEECNALDIAVTRINYKSAKFFYDQGMELKTIEWYKPKCYREFDIELMFSSLKDGVEEIPHKEFFVKVKKAREEWLARDLVVDRREGWKSWAWRQMNFEDPPLIPREDLPENLQPQNSITGKVVNYVSGIDPRLPAQKPVAYNQPSQIQMEMQTIDDPEAIRSKIKVEMAQFEKQEQHLEENKFEAEHDGMSMRGDDDPNVLHPQGSNFSPLEAQHAQKNEAAQIVDENQNPNDME